MSEPVIVPDVAGALVGWRCWGLARTDEGLQLVSHGGTVWPISAPLKAECRAHKEHLPPGRKCTCGIYALSQEEGIPYYLYNGAGYAVFGEVYLWGEVVRGTMGYRAQFAFPKALNLAHKDWRFSSGLRQAYRVPVHLRNPFPEEKR